MDPGTLTILGTAASALSTGVSAYGTIAGGRAQQAGLDYQAKVARIKARNEQAVGQRNALEARRKTALAQSQLQARAAASGAGASDPTVLDLAGDIGARGRYQEGLSMWQGQMRAWDYNTDAAAKEAQGSNIRSASSLSALGTILGGAGSLFKTFGSPYTSSNRSTSDRTYSIDDDSYDWPQSGFFYR